MAQQNRIGKHCTTVSTGEDGIKRVTYHTTVVLALDEKNKTVTFNSGGWKTKTTKTRINQACSEMKLPFHVKQISGQWIVGHEKGYEPFYDGMRLIY